MKQKIKTSIKTIGGILSIAISVFLLTFVVMAWTGPLHTPPTCEDGEVGCEEVLHTGTAAQSKEGGLLLNTGGATNGLIVQNGRVGIGIDSPTTALDVDGTVKATLFSGGGVMPTGGIIMWSGTLATIPTGWALCDGTNGTPDLRDRFVMGSADGVNPGVTGGTNSQTLAVENMPSHDHTFSATTSSTGAHTHALPVYGSTAQYTAYGVAASIYNSASVLISVNTAANGNHTHTVSGTTATQGSGTAFDNRPAFYALAFIMKI
jgi:microcystin-dependent protein